MATVTKHILLIVLLAASFLLQITINVSASDTQKNTVLKDGTVAVMPFFTGDYSDEIVKGRPPLQLMLAQITVAEDDMYRTGEKVLASLMNETLQKKLAQKLVPQAAVTSEFKNITIDNMSDTTLSVAVRLGKALNADYVVVGIVWDYNDRVGSKLAASEPATVSFSAFLVDVAAEKRIWREKFSKTQQSLSDNLFKVTEFFQQGARWLTAEELGRYGIKKVLETFPL